MITKIQPPAKDITSAITYNEKKMSGQEAVLSPEDEELFLEQGGTGHIVATFNVPDTSTLENEFTRLTWLNKMNSRGRKMEFPTFHMSINPGINDEDMTEEKAVRFAKELMDRLGYGYIPFRLYKHTDIDRMHYHIVGIRIGQDGRKINDSFEHQKCERITRELAADYGYVYGLDDTPAEQRKAIQELPPDDSGSNEERHDDTPERTDNEPSKGKESQPDGRKKPDTAGREEKKAKQFIRPYRKNVNGSDAEQYRSFHEEAMRWFFTTPEQYGFLLKYRFNTDISIYNDKLYYTGLDNKGVKTTVPMSEDELGIDALSDILKRIGDTDMKPKVNQRKRLEKNIRETAETSDSWPDFKANLAKLGILTAVSWNKDNTPFGLTWMDRTTRCIWKASETEATLAWIMDTAKGKGWKLTRNFRYEKTDNDNHKKTVKARNSANARRSGRLSDYSDKSELQKLMDKKGIGRTRRSEADASKNRAEVRYGDNNNNNDIVI